MTLSPARWEPDSKRWYLAYVLIALLAFSFGFWKSGYMVSLDMALLPGFPDVRALFYGLEIPYYGGYLPWYMLLRAFNTILTAEATSRILTFGTFALAGIGAHRLAPVSHPLAKLFAGLTFALNPFMFIKFVVGSWSLLWGYALIPFALKSFLDLLRSPTRPRLAATALWTTALSLNIHIAAVTLLAFAVLTLGYAIAHRGLSLSRIGHLAALGLVYGLLNAFWALPVVLSVAETPLAAITTADFFFFATPRGDLGSLFNVAAMRGYWGFGLDYALDAIDGWLPVVAVAGFLYLSVVGIVSGRAARWLKISLAVLGLIGIFVGAGVTGPLSEQIVALAERSTVFRGFRETYKFVPLVILSYSMLGALGVQALVVGRRATHDATRAAMSVLVAVAVLLPVVYTHGAFGFLGQLHTVDFPQDWQEARDALAETDAERTLFLPWHQFISYPWMEQQRSVFPLTEYFPGDVLHSEQLGIPGLDPEFISPRHEYVQALIEKPEEIDDFAAALRLLNIDYVLLAHAADVATYEFMSNDQGFEVVTSGPNITLYRNRLATAPAYCLTDPGNPFHGATALYTATISPAHIRIFPPRGCDTILFAPPDSWPSRWAVAGGTLIEDQTNAPYAIYQPDSPEMDLTFTPFATYRMSYVLSVLTLLILLVPLVRPYLSRKSRTNQLGEDANTEDSSTPHPDVIEGPVGEWSGNRARTKPTHRETA